MPQENVKWLELIPLLKNRAIRAAHGQVIRIIRPAIRNEIRQGNKTDKFLRVEAAAKPNGAEYSAHFFTGQWSTLSAGGLEASFDSMPIRL